MQEMVRGQRKDEGRWVEDCFIEESRTAWGFSSSEGFWSRGRRRARGSFVIFVIKLQLVQT